MGTPSVCVDKITHMAPDFSKFLRLRPHDALAASTKITIFTCGTGHAKHVRTRDLQNTVTHYDMIFNKGMAEERKVILRTRKIQLLSWCCIFLLQKHDTPHFPVCVCVFYVGMHSPAQQRRWAQRSSRSVCHGPRASKSLGCRSPVDLTQQLDLQKHTSRL